MSGSYVNLLILAGYSGCKNLSDAAARSEASLDDLGESYSQIINDENDVPPLLSSHQKKRKLIIDEEEEDDLILIRSRNIRNRNKGKGRLIPLGKYNMTFSFSISFSLYSLIYR